MQKKRIVLFIVMLLAAFLFLYLSTRCEAASKKVRVISSCKAKTVTLVLKMKHNVSYFRLTKNGELLQRRIAFKWGFSEYVIKFKKVNGKYQSFEIEDVRSQRCYEGEKKLCLRAKKYNRKKHKYMVKGLFEPIDRSTIEFFTRFKMAKLAKDARDKCPKKPRMKVRVRK